MMSMSSLLAVAALSSVTHTATLTADAWGVASPASVLANHEPMREFMQAVEAGNGVLVIRHASAEADRSRALALRAALVALGSPSARLRLEPAAAVPGILIIELHRSGPVSP